VRGVDVSRGLSVRVSRLAVPRGRCARASARGLSVRVVHDEVAVRNRHRHPTPRAIERRLDERIPGRRGVYRQRTDEVCCGAGSQQRLSGKGFFFKNKILGRPKSKCELIG
jgi:hypothetical protein